METTRERGYAAGDAMACPGRGKLIATDFGEAATATTSIAVALPTKARRFPGHPTDR